MSKPKPAEPRVIFTLRVFAQPAMSRAIECAQIRHAMTLASLEFGGGVGTKLAGRILDGHNLETGERTELGDFRYTPNAPS
jgi:hypothetical protein